MALSLAGPRLAELQFGPNFVNWIKTLYGAPRAKVRVNGEGFEWYQLARGTKQGCPLLLLLFALAMEPLAIAIRRGTRGETNNRRMVIFCIPVCKNLR